MTLYQMLATVDGYKFSKFFDQKLFVRAYERDDRLVTFACFRPGPPLMVTIRQFDVRTLLGLADLSMSNLANNVLGYVAQLLYIIGVTRF